MSDKVLVARSHKPVLIISINRQEKRNAVDRETAHGLYQAFLDFDADPEMSVAILTGKGANFCAGADLKAMLGADGKVSASDGNVVDLEKMTGEAPMGPTRMLVKKPVIAAISGYAVAGGFELACWCDLRVVDQSAILGIYCRMRGMILSEDQLNPGVPLIDGGTIRLPRLIGLSRAMDIILTGRDVPAKECLEIGLANYLAPSGETALSKALEIAKLLSSHPQRNLRNDRLSVYSNYDWPTMLKTELKYGLDTLSFPLDQVAKFSSKL